MASFRKKRLEELIKRIIGDMLIKGAVKDPRIGFVTVYAVELNDDNTVATVKISVLGPSEDKKKSLVGLNAAAGFVKFNLGKELKVRTIPDVVFVYDDSVEKGSDVVNLIDSIVKPEHTPDA